MNRMLRDVRLIPIVLFATVSLLALKVSGLVFDGGYTLAERMGARFKTDTQVATQDGATDSPTATIAERLDKSGLPRPKKSWAQDVLNFKDGRGGDVTGSTGAAEEKASEPALKVSDKPPESPKLEVAGAAIPLEPGRMASPGERAVLERLQTRRQELDTRSREMEMRENLLKAAEKRLEDKVAELKDAEGRVTTAMGTRDKVGAERFKSIVSMYENMKPKDAARIFDRLEMKILVDVSTQIKPQKMSEILAQMTPDNAERLTVELANRASAQPKAQAPEQLPKIEGNPSPN